MLCPEICPEDPVKAVRCRQYSHCMKLNVERFYIFICLHISIFQRGSFWAVPLSASFCSMKCISPAKIFIKSSCFNHSVSFMLTRDCLSSSNLSTDGEMPPCISCQHGATCSWLRVLILINDTVLLIAKQEMKNISVTVFSSTLQPQ